MSRTQLLLPHAHLPKSGWALLPSARCCWHCRLCWVPPLGKAWIRILNFALLYVMLALGLNIVVGFAGLLDLGYIAFYAVGAYTWALLASPHFDLHLPFWLVLPIGVALAAMAGIALGFPVLKLRGDYLAIVTLGFWRNHSHLYEQPGCPGEHHQWPARHQPH